MRILLIGPPGSGKGTQAAKLAEHLQLYHFGMGDELREAIRQNTPAGQQAVQYVNKGQLVPDNVVNAMVEERLLRDNRLAQFVMDGYPRIAAQARAFDLFLQKQQLKLDVVVQILVDDDEIVRRLSGRWNCPNPKCGATFHASFNPPRVTGICNRCQSTLGQRDDDREETVRHRLHQVFHPNTRDLLAYYQAKGLLKTVQGEGTIEDIYQRIVQLLPKG